MVEEVSNRRRVPCHTYVIDRNHRLVYLDKNAARVFPSARIGDTCHTVLRANAHPCSDCPMGISDNALHQKVLYNHRLRQWVEVANLHIDWPEAGECTLFSSKGIDENSRNLFSTFNSQGNYDELFEFDLVSNSHRVLYHKRGKYVLPRFNGTLEEILAAAREQSIHPKDREVFRSLWNREALLKDLAQGIPMLEGEYRLLLKTGEYRWVSQVVVPMNREEDSASKIMCFIVDIEEQKSQEEQYRISEELYLQKLLERNPLTGLYNGNAFLEKAELLRSENPDLTYELVYLDIEHFKLLNDWFGREVGDEMLKSIAARLKDIKAQYGGVIGYFGGDDFAALLPLGTSVSVGLDHQICLSPSQEDESMQFFPKIGVCAVDSTTPISTLCDHASLASGSIKGNYTTHIAWYDKGMAQKIEEDPKILFEVQRALKNREFVLYWQPQCSINTGKIVGFEALVRWQHPERGLVMPGEFIPPLERNGFIANLDLYVWEVACRHLRKWLDDGKRVLPISVNISRADPYSIDVVDALESLVRKYNLNRELLKLEITESSYVEDEKLSALINQLKDLGFVIFMDDFGSGYSSLNMLKDIKVDVVKIDMRFLNAVEDDLGRSESIMEAIMGMTSRMNLGVIAEGAETQEQVDFLRSVGCGYAQGYFYYRPFPTEALEELLSHEEIIDYDGIRKLLPRRPKP